MRRARFECGTLTGIPWAGRRLTKTALEGCEQCRDVIVQLGSWQRVPVGQRGIAFDGALPREQHRFTPMAEVLGQQGDVPVNFLHLLFSEQPCTATRQHIPSAVTQTGYR